jgi:hypothetical protein
MKIILYIVIIFATISCAEKKNPICLEFQGKCELRKFKCESEKNKTSSGYWVIAGGSYSSQETTKKWITFYCKNNNGEYCKFDVMPNKIRISINDTISRPYVIFHTKYDFYNDIYFCLYTEGWSRGPTSHTFDGQYVTIFCNNEDFPESLNIDQL